MDTEASDSADAVLAALPGRQTFDNAYNCACSSDAAKHQERTDKVSAHVGRNNARDAGERGYQAYRDVSQTTKHGWPVRRHRCRHRWVR